MAVRPQNRKNSKNFTTFFSFYSTFKMHSDQRYDTNSFKYIVCTLSNFLLLSTNVWKRTPKHTKLAFLVIIQKNPKCFSAYDRPENTVFECFSNRYDRPLSNEPSQSKRTQLFGSEMVNIARLSEGTKFNQFCSVGRVCLKNFSLMGGILQISPRGGV